MRTITAPIMIAIIGTAALIWWIEAMTAATVAIQIGS